MKYRIILIALAICLTAAALQADALWDATSGGGNSSQSPSYRLSSAVGQSVTGLVSGGDKVAQQGFLGGLSEPYFFICGDVTADSLVNITDVVFMLNRIFSGGPPPSDEKVGDVDCDGMLTVTDVVFIIQFIFNGGLEPCANCP